VLGNLFGGATAYPRGKGVWRDDEQGGKLPFESPSSSSATHRKRCFGTRPEPFESSWLASNAERS
jgi:hypothetical protein